MTADGLIGCAVRCAACARRARARARRHAGAAQEADDRRRAEAAATRRARSTRRRTTPTARSTPTSSARVKRLTGARRSELAGRAARPSRGSPRAAQLRAARLYPLLPHARSATREWWTTRRCWRTAQRVTFAGSELVWQYVPGQGLQLHPLANFGKLNAYAKRPPATTRAPPAARRAAGRSRCRAAAASRGSTTSRSTAAAAAVGQRALAGDGAAGARALGDEARAPGGGAAAIQAGPELFERGRRRACAWRRRTAPTTRCTRSGRALRIVNGFVQSLVGLYDFADITGDLRGAGAVRDGDAHRPREVPTYDTGAWSLYARGAITRESDLSYHTLLRDFLTRALRAARRRPSTATAGSHFTTYLDDPAGADAAHARVRGGDDGRLRFTLSKISRVAMSVTAPTARRCSRSRRGTVGRGTRTVSWTRAAQGRRLHGAGGRRPTSPATPRASRGRSRCSSEAQAARK